MQAFQLQQIFRWIQKNHSLYISPSSITYQYSLNLINDFRALLKGIQQFVELKLQNKISVRWEEIGIFMVWKKNSPNKNQVQNNCKSLSRNNKQTINKQNKQILKCNNNRLQNKQYIFNKLQSHSLRHKQNAKQQMKKNFKLTFQTNPKLNQSVNQTTLSNKTKTNGLNQQSQSSQFQKFKFVFPETQDMFEFVSNNCFAFHTKNNHNQQHQIDLNDHLPNSITQQKYEYVKQLNRIFIKAVFDLLQLDKKLVIQFKFVKIFMSYGQVNYKYNTSWLEKCFYELKNVKKNLFDDPVFKNRTNTRFHGMDKQYKQILKENFFPDQTSQKFIKKSINKYRKIGDILDEKFNKLINE